MLIDFPHWISSLLLIQFVGTLVHGDVQRPRGVSISRTSLYEPNINFTCLDGKLEINYNQINDDFCDCEDGSDEPGTSACSNGVFHCINAGHQSLDIPSSRVNDGICDCCDGSDEYASDANCVNNCLVLGHEEKERQKIQNELTKHGNKIRLEMSIKGKALKTEQENRLSELQKMIEQAQLLINDRRTVKDEAEGLESAALNVYREAEENAKREQQERELEESRQEALAWFARLDANGDNAIEVSEIQVHARFDSDRNGEVSIEEAHYVLDQMDQVDREQFITLSWPRIKPLLMLDAGLFEPPASTEEPDTEKKTPEPEGDEEEVAIDEAEDLDENKDEHLEEDFDDDDHERETTTESTASVEYDEDTKKLIESANAARNQLNEAERELRELESEMRQIEESVSKDYGQFEEYAVLSGQCVNFEDREYVYKLCPFDRASQQPRTGGAEIRLGTWDRWNGEPNKYSSMLYANGAACWNGPQRSTVVQLGCGLDTKITSVTEPNRCEYLFVMETPAACLLSTDSGDKSDLHDHDEL